MPYFGEALLDDQMLGILFDKGNQKVEGGKELVNDRLIV
ncbi:MAG: Uncharacterised protein [Cryomorphaceae bacterium]|nr:MAG: Uncharacterised protein [Cryomorphaceae bacterium]